MNFYQLIEQQYNDYKSGKGCDFCPCKTLRNKIFGKRKLREACSAEMASLILKYHITEYYFHNIDNFLCKDCMIASLIIAKKLFNKGRFNKI